MKPFFITYVNRETTQILLDIIGDYCSSYTNQYETDVYRLRFFVNARQHLGTIYVETLFRNTVLKRRYLKSMWWDGHLAPGSMHIAMSLEHVLEKLQQLRIGSKGIRRQIATCYEIDDYVLRLSPRR